MSSKALKIEEWRLDLQNPRFLEATSQRDALQKIIDDQDVKLVALAESIVENGLNPMDRLLVIKSQEEPGKFTVIEGNRRLAAIKLLHNPAVLTSLDVRLSVQKRFEAVAASFNLGNVEPLDCFEVAAREDGAMWIQQRHTGENGGRGIVDWNGLATARFRGNDPALQALDFVLQYGGFSESDKNEVMSGFPISTFDRLLSTSAVRDIVGVEIRDGKLLTGLPFEEVLKPLARIVRDLSTSVVTVTALKLQPQMVAYANGLGADLPDLSQLSTTTTEVENLLSQQGTSGGPSGGNGGGAGGGGGSGGAGSTPTRACLQRRRQSQDRMTARVTVAWKASSSLS